MQYAPPPPQAPVQDGVAHLPGGAHLYYWDTGGAGPAVIFSHPATGSARVWPYQQPVFAAAGYRTIGYSRRSHWRSAPIEPGHGGSASVDLRELADFLGVQKFHAVASAAGGAIVVDFAHSWPERLLSLTLSSSVGGVRDADYLALSESLRPQGFDAMPADFREIGASYRAVCKPGVAQWLALEHDALTGERLGQTPVNAISWKSLEAMRTPTLLMTGDADLWLPPAVLRLFAERLPDNEVAIVPEVGHAIYWEAPEVFNRLVLDFIARHSPKTVAQEI